MLLCLLLPVATHAATSPEELESFARSLFAEGEYYRTVTECKRFLHAFGAHERRTAILRLEARSLFLDGRFDGAARRFRHLSREVAEPGESRSAWLWSGLSLLRSGHVDEAIPILEGLSLQGQPSHPAARAAYELAFWEIRSGRIERALPRLRDFPPGSDLHPAALGMADELDAALPLPRRSPLLAGGLSALLPGAGHAYLGRPGEALTALVLNGLFLWAAVDAFEQDEPGLGVLLGSVEVGWYAGAIWSASSGARRYNHARQEELIRRLEARAPSPEELDRRSTAAWLEGADAAQP